MCGRFALYSDAETLAKRFTLKEPFEFIPNYNIAPSQSILVILERENSKRYITQMRWGLIPYWQKEEDISSTFINARLETAFSKPVFRHAFLTQRCLIPTDGFYEWSHKDKIKQPYLIRVAGHEPFALAGIWERWSKQDKAIESCSILTQDSIEPIKEIHGRMPVIVPRDKYNNWLDPSINVLQDVQKIIASFTQPMLEAYPVTKKINDPRYNKKEVIKKIIQPTDLP